MAAAAWCETTTRALFCAAPCWCLASETLGAGSQITVQMEDGSQFSDEAGSGSFMAMDEANLQSGPPPTHAQPSRLTPPLTPLGAADDMVNLGDLHEAALLHNARCWLNRALQQSLWCHAIRQALPGMRRF